ncbi:hypothetical protein Tco_0493915 [Tanacetum coccineum]
MSDDDGIFYFKFSSLNGLEQVLEQGPWLIRNIPLILTKWTPNLSLSKDKVTKVLVWVKLHKVTVVAYSEDGLSLISTQIGNPIMLDAFTSTMCVEAWGRIGYARALIKPVNPKLSEQKNNTNEPSNEIKLKNLFEKLNEITVPVTSESSGGNEEENIFSDPSKAT